MQKTSTVTILFALFLYTNTAYMKVLQIWLNTHTPTLQFDFHKNAHRHRQCKSKDFILYDIMFR